MDKKNTIIGALLLMVAFYLMFSTSKEEAQSQKAPAPTAAQSVAENPADAGKAAVAASINSPYAEDKNIVEELTVLKNDKISVYLTNRGGAIAKVDMLGFPMHQGSDKPFAFNDVKNALPAMGLAMFDASSPLPKPLVKDFKLVSSTPTSAVYELVIPDSIKITRTYALVQGDKDYMPFALETKTSIENISGKPINLNEVFVALGTVPPTESDVWGTNLALAMYDGNKSHFAKSSAFVDSSGFLGIGSHSALPYEKISAYPVVWGSIKNQFFASVFTPTDKTSNGGIAYPVLIDGATSNKYMHNAIAGLMGFETGVIEPGKTWELDGTFYAGPKELDRLYSLDKYQEEIMDYGWFGFVSRPLSRLMNFIHSVVSVVSPEWGWGWSIIILTLIVRLVMWPLTSIQIKSAQRMAKLAKPLKEIKEKYKDDPKRVQQETMKMYSEYGINPLAGCLPVLIQIPIFIGLYYMLQTSAEIRFAHFLWITDLSLPDTISWLPSVFGMPIHILPLLNAGVTFIQMHITPMPSVDKTQAIMFKLMPVIMLVFFYTFPSGLVLYWLVQSCLGILQAIITRRGVEKVEFKKRNKPGLMQRMSSAMEQAQSAQKSRGPEFEKLSMREKMKVMQEEARKARQIAKEEKLKGTANEKRKKNPGGRSTPKKR